MAVAALAAVSAGAEERDEMTDSLTTVKLQEVQVVSTRAQKNTPMSYSDLDKKEIEKINYGQDIPFLLSATPSVTFTSDAGNGIGYTTIRVRGTDPSRINITSNGVPMNDSESSQVFWVNMGDFASSVQSMQIQRGVGTSTNGSGAFGATLNMQTENIGVTPFVGLDLAGGSYLSHKETVRFGTGLIADHWGLQGRLSNIGSKGYIDRASTKLNSYFLQGGYFSDNTMVKILTYNGVEETYHAWNYTSKWEQQQYGRTYNSCGEYWDADGNRHYYSDQTDNYHQQNYQLHWNQILTDQLKMNVALHYTKGNGYYNQYKSSRTLFEYNLDKDETWAKSDLVRRKAMDNDFYGFVASLVYDNSDGLQATLGGGWNKYDGDHFGLVTWVKQPVSGYSFDPDWKYYDNNTKKTDANIYAKASYEFSRGLSGFLDLQYRHVGITMTGDADAVNWDTYKRIVYGLDKKYDFFNPKAGVNYQIDRNNRAYISYAVANREPVRNNFENALNALATEMPVSERLGDLEAGYKYQNSKFAAGANFYYMHYKDQFVLTGALDAIGEALTANVDKSYRLGVELEAAWQPADWFRWDVNATLSRNRVEGVEIALEDGGNMILDGEKPLSFSPDIIFNNVFTFNYRGFEAGVISQFVGDQYLTNTGFKTMECADENGNTTYETLQLKNHWNTNLNLSYKFGMQKYGIKDVTLGCTIYNIFSAEYDNNGWAAPQYRKQSDGSVTAVNTWGCRDAYAVGFAPSAPINFMAHLSINF